MKAKMLFAIIALSLSILLSGCTSNYDLVIKEDNSVKETFEVTIPNEKISKNKDEVELFLDNRIETYQKINDYKNYKYKQKIGKDTSSLKMTINYKSLKDYSKSPFMKNVFENLTIIENKKFTTFKTVGRYYYNYIYGVEPTDESYSHEGSPTQSTIGNINISIKLHNKLIESNADVEDKENNIYTWKLTPDSKEEYIYLKYSNEKRYDIIFKDFISDYIIAIISIGVIIGIILVAVIIIGGKHLINNKI